MGQTIPKNSKSKGPYKAYQHRPPQAMKGLERIRPHNLAIDPNDPKVGHYLRQGIIYHFTHAITMAAQWEKIWPKFIMKHKAANETTRKAFWNKERTNKIMDENFCITAMERDIAFACHLLVRLQSSRGRCTQHENLQTRSEYLMRLCIAAITDLRLMSQATTTIGDPSPAAIHQLPDLGYNSGLNNNVPYVAYVSIDSPFLFEKTATFAMKFKLPLHFIQLLDVMYGQVNWQFKPRLFMYLLARYTLFLSFLLWMPSLYDDELVNSWYDPYKILYLDRIPTDQDIAYLETSMAGHPWLQGQNTNVKDTDVIVGTAEAPMWTDCMPGVQYDDNTNIPLKRPRFESFIENDDIQDKSMCRESIKGYFSRVTR